MKTETENLRELDAWIAEHVMGWRVFTSGRGSVCCEVEGGGIRIIDARHPWETSDFSPTTDSAAAMLVLEKCTGETTVTIRKQSDGSFCIWWTESENMRERSVFGGTLPIVICRFAKQLFSK